MEFILTYEICEHSENFLTAFECCENGTEEEFKMMVVVKGPFHGKKLENCIMLLLVC